MTEDHRAVAWGSFVTWALGEPDLRAAFEDATGIRFGAVAAVERFVHWVTVEHYGIEFAPATYRDAQKST